MDPTTILSLNDDCLCNIVSFISDRNTFSSLARTCKRLQQVTNNTRNQHIEIRRSKADYYIKQFIVGLGSRGSKSYFDSALYDEYCKFKNLVDSAVHCISARSLLTYEKIVEVWRRNGPVACEIFTWIRNSSSSVEEGHPRATCSTQYTSFTVHLPKCNQEMTVKTKFFHDYIRDYDDELSIEFECGDLKIEERDLRKMMPVDYKYWSDEEVEEVVNPMKPVIDLLQEELGETVPQIGSYFLLWFLLHFPTDNLYEEDKLMFKDVGKNEKPCLQSVQPRIEFYQKNISKRFQKSSEKYRINANATYYKQESESCKSIVESLGALMQNSDGHFFRRLDLSISRLYNVASSSQFKKLPEKLMFGLILRTTVETDNFSPGSTADKVVENIVSFRLLGGKAMKVHGVIEGDGQSYPIWERLVLNFHIPDEVKIELDSGNIYVHGNKLVEDIVKLSPVTKLLQECINQSLEGEQQITEITDVFTAVYFLYALDFGMCDSFLEDVLDQIVKEEEADKSSDDLNSD